jgi:ribosome maturation factor RimP
MDLETPLRSVLSPLGVELYDLEFASGTLSVVLTAPGGITTDRLAEASRAISAWLDANDPIPTRYTLDVSSPGLERKLRTPAHFASTIGEVVTLRERRDGEPTRRLEGTVTAVDGESITLNDTEVGSVRVLFSQIERARTVFAWGATSPSKSSVSSKKG